MSGEILSVENLSAGYAGSPVLHKVSLAMRQHQIFGLIGPNGHGKTTLLRVISGLVQTSEGSIRYDGTDITGMAVSSIVHLGLIHVPQGDLLFGEMSVMDNLLVGATRPDAKNSINENLDKVFDLLPRLKERRTQMAFTLSGGERRMLAIGRGLMAQGNLLMLDEPSLGLAPAVIDEIYDVVQRLVETGVSVLLVEENVNRAAEVSNYMALMDHGEVVWQGEPHELSDDVSIDQTYFGG